MQNETNKNLLELYNNWEAPKPMPNPPRSEVRFTDYLEENNVMQEVFASPDVAIPVSDFGGK